MEFKDLVNLYDSVNNELEKIRADFEEYNRFALNPTDERAHEEVKKFYKRLEARQDQLLKLRDKIEYKLSIALEGGVI